jgi:type VII secretion protein EccE
MSPRQRAGRLAARIAGWQVAAACLLLPIAVPARIAAGATVAALVALLSLKRRGHRLPGLLLVRAGFRRRERGYRARSAIEAVVPGVDTRAHADRAGNRVGLLADGPEWTAMLRLDPIPETALVDRLAGLLHELALTVTAADALVDAAQLVGWSVPQPGPRPPARTFWVAVRFRPGFHAAAVEARGGGEQGAVRSVAVAALRLATSLRQRGYGLRVLDGAELTDELGTSLGLEPPGRSTGRPAQPPGRAPVARETWRSWSVGALHHACFRLRRPPRQPARLAALFTQLARPPAITTCVSVLYSRDAGETAPRREVVVRVAAPAERSPRVVRRALRRAAAGIRGRLVPMNGEHLPGVRATVPLAAPP